MKAIYKNLPQIKKGNYEPLLNDAIKLADLMADEEFINCFENLDDIEKKISKSENKFLNDGKVKNDLIAFKKKY